MARLREGSESRTSSFYGDYTQGPPTKAQDKGMKKTKKMGLKDATGTPSAMRLRAGLRESQASYSAKQTGYQPTGGGPGEDAVGTKTEGIVSLGDRVRPSTTSTKPFTSPSRGETRPVPAGREPKPEKAADWSSREQVNVKREQPKPQDEAAQVARESVGNNPNSSRDARTDRTGQYDAARIPANKSVKGLAAGSDPVAAAAHVSVALEHAKNRDRHPQTVTDAEGVTGPHPEREKHHKALMESIGQVEATGGKELSKRVKLHTTLGGKIADMSRAGSEVPDEHKRAYAEGTTSIQQLINSGAGFTKPEEPVRVTRPKGKAAPQPSRRTTSSRGRAGKVETEKAPVADRKAGKAKIAAVKKAGRATGRAAKKGKPIPGSPDYIPPKKD